MNAQLNIYFPKDLSNVIKSYLLPSREECKRLFSGCLWEINHRTGLKFSWELYIPHHKRKFNKCIDSIEKLGPIVPGRIGEPSIRAVFHKIRCLNRRYRLFGDIEWNLRV